MAWHYDPEERPQFTHDCIACVFLGRYGWNDLTGGRLVPYDYDLYFHRGKVETTVIARYGSAPEEYASGLGMGMRPLLVAQLRAVQLGLLMPDEIET